jgi:hypothetical protein
MRHPALFRHHYQPKADRIPTWLRRLWAWF